MSEEKDAPDENAELLARIKRMDKIVDALLVAAEDTETSAKAKASLFSTIVGWQKQRAKLLPSGEGNELKRMVDGIKSKGYKRAGVAAGKRDRSPPKQTGAIEAIIRDLHRKGGNAADPGGDPQDSERSSGGDAGPNGGIRINGRGNGVGHMDEPLDGRLV